MNLNNLSGLSREQVGVKFVRSEKLQNESSPNFSIFVPEFVPNFATNFPRIFRGFYVLCFVGNRDQKENHQKSPPLFNAKFPGKHEKKNRKMFLESRQSKCLFMFCLVSWVERETHKGHLRKMPRRSRDNPVENKKDFCVF